MHLQLLVFHQKIIYYSEYIIHVLAEHVVKCRYYVFDCKFIFTVYKVLVVRIRPPEQPKTDFSSQRLVLQTH